jgi:hypothetical protein
VTTTRPSRLAISLLHRYVPDSEPLIGDLLEEFEVRRSRLWLWRQVLIAILTGRQPRRRELRPLALMEEDFAVDRLGLRTPPERWPRNINLSASPVTGVGGLGLLALGVLVTVVNPHIWWWALYALVGGVLLGMVLVLVRRRRGLSTSREESTAVVGRRA